MIYLFVDSKANKPIYSIDVSVEPDEAVSTHNLMVGSRIKYIRRGGVIKWIGNLSDLGSEVYAGIEMVGSIIHYTCMCAKH